MRPHDELRVGELRVEPFAGGWAIFSDRGHPLSETFAVREEAIAHARRLASARGGAPIVVDGAELPDAD